MPPRPPCSPSSSPAPIPPPPPPPSPPSTATPLDPAWLLARVEGYWAEIDPSAERDQAVWGDAYRSYGGWAWERDQANDWTDYRAEKAYLRRWLNDRADVIQTAHP